MPITEKRKITPRAQTFRKDKPQTREEMMIEALSPNLMIMVKAARKAGRRMLRDFGEVANLQISRKGPGDFVSNADMLAEKTLIEQLSYDRPDYGFITEEAGTIPARNNSPYTWVIDPIDGTINFIHAIPTFAISIALLERDEVIAGIVFNPITNDLYYAEKGKGSYVMTPTGTVRLRVSARNKLEQAVIGSCGFRSEKNRETVTKLTNGLAATRFNGCTTLSLASVAAGQFDGYVSCHFNMWDIAAGYLLVKEAGGFASDFGGKRKLSEILESQTLVASNVALKETFLKALEK